MSLLDVCVGLAANLERIEETQVSAFPLPNPQPPTIQVLPGPSNFMVAMGRLDSNPTLIIQAFVPFAEGWQRRLLEFCAPLGAWSVKEAAESDQTLGGAATNVTVTEHGGATLAAIGGQDVLLVEFTCSIYTEGA